VVTSVEQPRPGRSLAATHKGRALLPVPPLCKWPGGKSRELPQIQAALPDRYGRLIDPFVGGGALLFATPARIPAAINDASGDLVGLYRRTQSADPDFLDAGRALATWWDGMVEAVDLAPLVDAYLAATGGPAEVAVRAAATCADLAQSVPDGLPTAWTDLGEPLARQVALGVPAKLGRMRRVEQRHGSRLPDPDVWRNVEGAVRAAAYTAIRAAYNAVRLRGDESARQTVRFLFLREYAYAAMFRFNRRGEFNVPYGGITYNRKPFQDRIAHLASAAVTDRLATTTVACADFQDFLDDLELCADDVVFLDPPYDSEFSTYDRAGFGPDDHRRLAATIRRLPCAFQMVIRDTPLVRELYLDGAWRVQAFDHIYSWTIKDRNDRAATHLLITNADLDMAAAG
jgi:DNA adenine methylase